MMCPTCCHLQETADAQLTKEGRWILECRVADHITSGMQVRALVPRHNTLSLQEAETFGVLFTLWSVLHGLQTHSLLVRADIHTD